MRSLKKYRLAALLLLLSVMLIAAGCSRSDDDNAEAGAPAHSSTSALASPAGDTVPAGTEAAAPGEPAEATPAASPGTSATASGDTAAPGHTPASGDTAAPGQTLPPSDTAAPSDTPSAGPAEPAGSGQVPVSSADPSAAPARPTPSASALTPGSTQQPASSGTKPAGTPEQPVKASPSPFPKPPQSSQVTLSVVGDADSGTILAPAAVELKEGDSVLDVLKRATRSRKIQMEYQGKGGAAYVEGIDNLYEFDKGAKSGWLFRVNGGFPGKSAGAYKLKDGDVVEWLYTLDMGKDVGKGADEPEKESGS
ncbi:DUF4430 domain-containing protein [Cohnella sp. JJ-181]|uniref:DUF4430 domain-containing protein n=1 Tax=Cohnella rhizoplanae TaxID=2974897 RepID=UPI0022FF6E60|nr:DUF4430 domain-containing protein [Cohnella sp. JJ-181]CAI6086877.1 hypothetical protein COHCIP112018_05220 [Cohnella sp. JJ-181]